MPELADYLTARFSTGAYGQEVFLPVVDRTGIDGAWDVVLDRTDLDPTMFVVINHVHDAMESFSASLGRLGLKVARTKAPSEQLVIEHVDMTPTEN